MMPIGPLMVEHRLIERMIVLMKRELEEVEASDAVRTAFLHDVVDFLRTYADRCHHGKEEHILFRELREKDLSAEHEKTLEELIQEHVYGRETVAKLASAGEAYQQGEGDSVRVVKECLAALVQFYPQHIEKEDKHFFFPCMDYFTEAEKDEMLREFREFDRALVHQKYAGLVKRLEA
jgi:hemerythrin-like domain-containing protein